MVLRAPATHKSSSFMFVRLAPASPRFGRRPIVLPTDYWPPIVSRSQVDKTAAAAAAEKPLRAATSRRKQRRSSKKKRRQR